MFRSRPTIPRRRSRIIARAIRSDRREFPSRLVQSIQPAAPTSELTTTRILIAAILRPVATDFSIGPGNTRSVAVLGTDPLPSTQMETSDGRRQFRSPTPTIWEGHSESSCRQTSCEGMRL
jgi:hypothetical protein